MDGIALPLMTTRAVALIGGTWFQQQIAIAPKLIDKRHF
jgi:hypothetical protein